MISYDNLIEYVEQEFRSPKRSGPPRFYIGERVRIHKPGNYNHTKIGRITKVMEKRVSHQYRVTFNGDSGGLIYLESELRKPLF